MFAQPFTPTPIPEQQSEDLSFVHFKETRNYTRFSCVAYHTPPALTGSVGDIFLAGGSTEPTAWVRGHQGWALADKTTDEKGVPKQVHPDYLGYIRLDPKESKWKSTWDFRPKPAHRKRKKPSDSQEEQKSGEAGTGSPVDTTSIMEILGAMKDCQERTIEELVAVKDDHTHTKAELETVKGEYARTKAELDALREDYMGTKAELEHAKANIQRAESDAQNLKADLERSKTSIQLAETEMRSFRAGLTPSTVTPMDTPGGTEIEDLRSKLQAAEAAIEGMKAQIALTSANLSASTSSNGPTNSKEDLHYGDLKHRIRTMLDNMDK
ncbi:hypothetical protein FA13DRAFT_1815397 [Coprinellus micaceus]|uniref:Uncharacterized protein n=1 Tax=Coprinellus micaceus TaxID=71717 RepID=A0A4Y7T544_COPMI|nr:hypothetical protein FA13DRAFT_1815397 [Coprinellus micaceus]